MAGKDGREGRGPVILDVDDAGLPGAPAPAEAPPVEDGASPAADRAMRRAARGGRWPGLLWSAALGLLALWASTSLWDFAAGLFARSALLGWIGAVLLAGLAVALAALAVREIAGLARLARIERVQARARSATGQEAPGPARAVVADLATLYAGRPEMADTLARLSEQADEMPDGPAILETAERRIAPALDAAAERAVVRAARRVAAVTAFVPMPALDLIAVLFQNLVMIRSVAEVYGGRAGWLGSWRLLRAVAQHLVATGAIAATDDMLGPLVGGGVLGRISRRFGEAAVNAALTARVGVAAVEVCRPLPFAVRPAPTARRLVLSALSDWRREEGGGR